MNGALNFKLENIYLLFKGWIYLLNNGMHTKNGLQPPPEHLQEVLEDIGNLNKYYKDVFF